MSEFCPYTYKGFPTGLEDPWTFPMPSEQERDRRWQAIRRSMKEHTLDCLIVGAPYGYMPLTNHIYYISNYVPFFNHGTHVVFPLGEEPQLIVSNAIGPQFLHGASETSWIREIVGSLHPAQDIVKKVKQLRLENSSLGVVGYRSGAFSASVYDVLRQSFTAATFTDATAALGAR